MEGVEVDKPILQILVSRIMIHSATWIQEDKVGLLSRTWVCFLGWVIKDDYCHCFFQFFPSLGYVAFRRSPENIANTERPLPPRWTRYVINIKIVWSTSFEVRWNVSHVSLHELVIWLLMRMPACADSWGVQKWRFSSPRTEKKTQHFHSFTVPPFWKYGLDHSHVV